MPSDSMKSSYAPRPQKDGRFCSVALAALVSLIVRTLYRISMRWDTCAPVFQDVARTVRVAASPDQAWAALLDFRRVASWHLSGARSRRRPPGQGHGHRREGPLRDHRTDRDARRRRHPQEGRQGARRLLWQPATGALRGVATSPGARATPRGSRRGGEPSWCGRGHRAHP
ncbi:MAG: hypothetical protein E6J27_14360 [Chloroflexi bacterium]|nr:MAG: hypothetical protein E6J27_14360 [Chloroflexota bacterium]